MMKCKICGQEFFALSEDGKCRICLQKERGLINIQLTQQQWSPRVIGYSEPNVEKNLINPDELIIKEEIIKIEYSYPLSVKAVFEYKNKDGFSRMDLWRCIYNGYKKIYDEEEKVAEDPGTAPGLLNRALSSGPYGIWGHDIGELHIEKITYHQKNKLITLSIGS